MKNQSKARALGRRFWVEVPPVEWILEFHEFRVGKHKHGLLIVERYAYFPDSGVGWVVYEYPNFQAIIDETGGRDYENDFLRALAHKLGIEKLPWTPAGCKRPLWIAADEFLADYTYPEDPQKLRARQERSATQLEAEGRFKESAAFRDAVGLPPPKPKLSLPSAVSKEIQ